MSYSNQVFLWLVLSLSIVWEVKAQQDRFLVGGVVGYDFSNNKPESSTSTKASSLSATPFVGYSATERLMVGLAYEFYRESTEYRAVNLGYFKRRDHLIAPFVRYYINSSFFFHGQFNYGFSRSEQKSTFDGDIFKSRTSVWGIGLGIGYDIRLTDAVQLEPLIRYRWNKSTNEVSNVESTQTGVVVNLGLVYRF